MADRYYFFDTKKRNYRVTERYVSIIREALKKAGKECQDIVDLPKKNNGNDYGIVAIDSFHVLKARLRGYEQIIYWVQGIVPEESYMRNKSKLRMRILSAIEKKALKSAKFVIFVSESMRSHYKEKYKFSPENYYVMPCFSADMDYTEFFESSTDNVFLYSGGLAVWQCFPETVDLYKKIEEKYGQTRLIVLTSEQELARDILEKYGIRNYEIDYLEGEAYRKILQSCKFGFCIRKNDVVNRVATPTKYSDYISNGIIPIYTKNTEDFYQKSKGCKYCLCIDDKDFWDRLDNIMCDKVEKKDIVEIFRSNFSDYYSASFHIKNMAKAFFSSGI